MKIGSENIQKLTHFYSTNKIHRKNLDKLKIFYMIDI